MPLINAPVILAVVTALGSPVSSIPAPDCIQMDFSRVRTLCADQPTPLSMSVLNACSTPQQVALTFSVDHETIREKASIVVAPLETLAQRVLIPLPSSIRSGLHTLTVSVKDAGGNVRSTDLKLPVASCDLPVASVEFAQVGPSGAQKK
jgi:hypothetical protein